MRGTYLDDRLAAIAGLAPAELARRIEQLPPVAVWMVDRGRIGPLAPTAGPNPTRQALAAALADDDVILLTLQLLDTSSLRLVLVLAARDGQMERGAIDHIALLGPPPATCTNDSSTPALMASPPTRWASTCGCSARAPPTGSAPRHG